jgi:bifunctional DNA-binding transcriptional regulator/antitoxin component of YhaV-PrlF toxin-antitoxin module
MAAKVKKTAHEVEGRAAGETEDEKSVAKGETRRSAGRSRISSKHQITIPIGAFNEAGLREGDIVQVQAQGPGRVVIARMDDLLNEYAGCLSTGGELGRAVRGMDQAWG